LVSVRNAVVAMKVDFVGSQQHQHGVQPVLRLWVIRSGIDPIAR
jgi:hypothetical protein